MAEQTFLIQVRRQFRAGPVKALVDQIHRWGGQTLLLTNGGYTLVVRLDERYRELVEGRPEVALIGGVRIQPRRVRRIRVDAAGRRMPPNNPA